MIAKVLIGLAAVLLAGCATTVEGARPDDASAAGHRQAAEHHERLAEQHAAQFDPRASTSVDVPLGPGGTRQALEAPVTVERFRNPTVRHRGHAADHRAHARQHAAAAALLERSEEEACSGVLERDVCPLADTIRSVENVPNGVLLEPAGESEALLRAVRCHLAVARTRHHDGMDGCPLFLKGVMATVTESGGLLLQSESPETVEALQLSFSH